MTFCPKFRGRPWTLEQVKSNPDEEISIPLSEIISDLEKSILLIGQSFNNAAYQRRLNVLLALTKDTNKAKTQLKEKSSLLLNYCNELFGKKFQEYISETAKTRQKSRELYQSFNEEGKQPFRAGPSRQNNGKPKNSGGRKVTFTKFSKNGYNKNPDWSRQGSSGKNKIYKEPFQHVSRNPSRARISTNSSSYKKIVFKKDCKRTSCRKVEVFCERMGVINSGPKYSECSKRLQSSLLTTHHQPVLPHITKMNAVQNDLVNKEIENMLKKGAIQIVPHIPGEFLSNLFLVGKKDEGHRPIINLKHLNSFIPYQHFKMEGLHMLKDLLQEGDYMCKLDLKDAYFTVPMNRESKKFLRFQWQAILYEFQCLCFGLGPAPLIFTKLMKVPIALLRRLSIRIIIYLDDMLIMAQSRAELLRHRDTVIFLLQHLGFIINLKKSVLTPVQEIGFLGLDINSLDMTLLLPQQKLNSIVSQCQEMLKEQKTTVIKLTQLIGRLSATAQAVLPARLQHRYLQWQQIQAFKYNNSYQQTVILNQNSQKELLWWVENLKLCNGRSLITPPADLLITTDASKKGWGASCQTISTGGQWSLQERDLHINVLELKAVQLAILTFTKTKKEK